MDPVWWVSFGPGQVTSVPAPQLVAMAAAGTVTPATLVCTAGTQWFPAGMLTWLTFPARPRNLRSRWSSRCPCRLRRRLRARSRALRLRLLRLRHRTGPAQRRPRRRRPRVRAAVSRREREREREELEEEEERDRQTREDGSIQFGTAVGFVFKDPKWFPKVALLGLLLYVPLLGYIVVRGWRLELARRVYAGRRNPLPDWSRFGTKITDGLILAGMWLLYQLPALVGSGLMVFLFFLPYLRYLFDSDQRDAAELGLSVTKWALRLIVSLLLAAYAVAADVMFLVAQTRYIATDRAAVFFDLRSNFLILRRHPGVYAWVFIYRFILNVVVNVVRIMLALTGIGSIFIPGLTSPPLHWTSGHLFGQAAAATDPQREPDPATSE